MERPVISDIGENVGLTTEQLKKIISNMPGISGSRFSAPLSIRLSKKMNDLIENELNKCRELIE